MKKVLYSFLILLALTSCQRISLIMDQLVGVQLVIPVANYSNEVNAEFYQKYSVNDRKRPPGNLAYLQGKHEVVKSNSNVPPADLGNTGSRAPRKQGKPVAIKNIPHIPAELSSSSLQTAKDTQAEMEALAKQTPHHQDQHASQAAPQHGGHTADEEGPNYHAVMEPALEKIEKEPNLKLTYFNNINRKKARHNIIRNSLRKSSSKKKTMMANFESSIPLNSPKEIAHKKKHFKSIEIMPAETSTKNIMPPALQDSHNYLSNSSSSRSSVQLKNYPGSNRIDNSPEKNSEKTLIKNILQENMQNSLSSS